MRIAFKVSAVALAALAVGSPAFAHHSFAMFDFTKRTMYEGVVEEFDWSNPHSHIIIRVPAGAKNPATVGRWDIEGQAPNIMRRQGWSGKSLKVGDKVTIAGFPMRDGSKAASLDYALIGGKEYYGDVNRRDANGRPILSAAPAQ